MKLPTTLSVENLYALSDEARDELILLMLAGRGDVEHAFTRALDARSRYVDADDQVAYFWEDSKAR
jgi:hypothetical protein